MNRLSKRRTTSGMTLMELLVVIAIIGILAGLLLPSIGAARRRAHRLRSQIEVKLIKDALWAYELDYGHWPGNINEYSNWPPTDDKIEEEINGIETASNAVSMLRGSDTLGMNPDSTQYLAVHKNRHLRADGAFADPWGNPYKYMCDYDRDNAVHIEFSNFSGELTLYKTTVAVWSRGPDQSDETGSRQDDVISW